MIDAVDQRDMSLRVDRLGQARVASGGGRNRRQIINALKADSLEGEMERKTVIDDIGRVDVSHPFAGFRPRTDAITVRSVRRVAH
jgi:hypothetical protein